MIPSPQVEKKGKDGGCREEEEERIRMKRQSIVQPWHPSKPETNLKKASESRSSRACQEMPNRHYKELTLDCRLNSSFKPPGHFQAQIQGVLRGFIRVRLSGTSHKSRFLSPSDLVFLRLPGQRTYLCLLSFPTLYSHYRTVSRFSLALHKL